MEDWGKKGDGSVLKKRKREKKKIVSFQNPIEKA
jgi:hypothetical protein